MEVNPFYKAAADMMFMQLEFLEELIGRPLTSAERDNLHEFYLTLPPNLQSEFEVMCGPLV